MDEQEKTKIIEEIASASGKTIEEVNQLIKERIEKLSGLLTESGAIYLIQKELGLRKESLEKILVSDLVEGMKGIEVEGTIKTVFPVKEFERNQKKGKLRTFILEDAGGEVRTTLWNEQVEEYDLRKGDEVLLSNVIVNSYNESKQLALGFSGRIEVTKKSEPLFIKLADLESGMGSVSVVGRIMRKFPIKEFESQERRGKLVSFQLGDASAIIRATAWNEKAEELNKFDEGVGVEVDNAYTKEGRFGVELHLGYSAEIRQTSRDLPNQVELLKEQMVLRKISDTNEGENALIEGKISSVERGKLFFVVCSKCGKKITSTMEGFLCEGCGEVEPKRNPVLSVILQDESANIKVNLFGENVYKVIKLNQSELEEKTNSIGVDETIDELTKALIGEPLKVFGYTKINSFTGDKELTAREILD